MNYIADGLIIAFIWFLAIYIQQDDHISKIRNIKLDDAVKSKILILCKTIIFALIIVDVTLMFKSDLIIMNNVKRVLGLPFISHLIFVAESILVFFYTIELSRVNLSHMGNISKVKLEKIVFGNGLVVLGGYFALLFLKSLIWGRFTYLYSINGYMNMNIELSIGIILLLIPSLGIIFAGYQYKDSKKALSFILPITILVLFAHSILVRALILIELLDGLTTNIHHKFVEEWIEMDDDILALSTATHSKNALAKMNGYYLYGFGLTVFLLWTLQMSYLLPSKSVYSNESAVIIPLILVFVLFWIIEVIAHNTGKFGDIFRMIFIPVSIIIIILPFLTANVALSTDLMMPGIQDLYHLITNALGDLYGMFFVSLIILQATCGYLMYIIIGTGEKIKKFYAILPLSLMIQLILLALIFPLLAVFPPYLISEHSTSIIYAIVIVFVSIAVIVASLIAKLFAYKKIRWDKKISKFWKKRSNIYILVIMLTMIIATPLVMEVITSKINNNGVLEATFDLTLEEDEEIYKYVDQGNGIVTFLAKHMDNYTKIIQYDLEAQNKLWELKISDKGEEIYSFGESQFLFFNEDRSSFVIIDKLSGSKVYEYKAGLVAEFEFFNIDFNHRSILITENLRQFVYDAKLGEVEVATIGNSFYKLIKGTQLALLKNNSIYKYDGENFIEKQTIEGIKNEDYVYYLDKGLLIFNNSGIVEYDLGLTTKETYEHNFFGSKLLNVYDTYNNKILFDTSNNNKQYIYIINLQDYTRKSVLLEQKIKGFNDIQNISFDRQYENYILYDQYQVTFYEADIRVARYWFDGKSQVKLKPVVNGKTVFIIDTRGEVEKVNIIK